MQFSDSVKWNAFGWDGGGEQEAFDHREWDGRAKWGTWLKGDLAAAAKSPQSCPTLRDPRDGSTPGSAVPGILQARTLKWVAISFSNA